MSDKNNHCPRCDMQPYYDGHASWCLAIGELLERIERIERHVTVTLSDGTGTTLSNPDFDPVDAE